MAAYTAHLWRLLLSESKTLYALANCPRRALAEEGAILWGCRYPQFPLAQGTEGPDIFLRRQWEQLAHPTKAEQLARQKHPPGGSAGKGRGLTIVHEFTAASKYSVTVAGRSSEAARSSV
jgi:hypothetical protein